MTLLSKAIQQSLVEFNEDTNNSWTFGTNWNGKLAKPFEKYVNGYLFPKINETLIVEAVAGNRFDWLAKEIDFIGQYSEEYVILDSVPIEMDMSKDAELMLKRVYPEMATKLYSSGILKKVKFTLNNNAQRFNFAKISDAVNYALAVLRKKISDINIAEESEMKAMVVDYALNFIKDKRTVNSMESLFEEITEAILNLQNNSHKHNESDTATNGTVATFTTNSKLSDLLIVTTDKAKRYLLNTMLANTFHNDGIDLSDRIISFDDLGGVFKANKDITLTEAQAKSLAKFGDYQSVKGDIIPKGTVFTFDVSKIFNTDVTEIKPTSDLFAVIFDIRGIRYKRYTKELIKEPFYNGEFDEVTYWLHYYSMKAISPFYNKVVVTG